MSEAEHAEAAGHRELARRRYESVLYLLRGAARASDASVILRRIGRLYFDDGDFAAGVDCLTAALATAEAVGDSGLIARATNVMAIGHWQRGLIDDAERLYRLAFRAARQASDTKLAAMVEQNLGILAQIRGDVAGALTHYEASLAGYRALGLDEFIGKLLGNMGLAYTHLERWAEAERIYQEALAICAACGDVTTALMVEGNRAEAQIARGLYTEAELVCDRVLRRARTLNDTRAIAESQKYLGVVMRETQRPDEAERYLREAMDGAMSREDLLLAAEVAREQAELFSSLRRERETLQALNASHRLFTRLRAERALADIGRRTRRLEQRFLDIVSAWARSIESKDAYTLGHCERVADYACAIADAYGIGEANMFWFRLGAVLHDVGKIAVPLEVLNKPGKLTPEERALMESHPVAGVEMLKDVEFPWDVLPMVRSHHERWDGRGYPDQLAGEDIPLHARILCVADVFDALTTDRPYRRAFSREEALRIMREDSGRGFDPAILACFEQIVDRVALPPSAAAPVERPRSALVAA
ncbi:MAG TPA: HD domain-containing phosphohydrolase [Gemmatimonadaceae bacterium]|nr:HD domain-containing phosphohydrolase [Gemmatimonadaceae bacterium]